VNTRGGRCDTCPAAVARGIDGSRLRAKAYHSLKAGHDYGQYVRDAENAGEQEIADFFKQVMEQDSERAHRCHAFLARLGGTDNTSPQT
jgi:rubrerythrin